MYSPAEKRTDPDKDQGEIEELSPDDNTYNASELDYEYYWWPILCAVLTTSVQLLDIGSDVFVAFFIRYHTSTTYFVLTLAFVILPAAFTFVFSSVQQALCRRRQEKENYMEPPTVIKVLRWILLPINSVTSEVEFLYYGYKKANASPPNTAEQYKTAMNASKLQGTLVRVMEAMLEAAPQLLLLLYIELSSGYGFNMDVGTWTWKSWLLVGSLSSSLFGMALSVRTFYAVHRHLEDGFELKIRHQILLYFGRLFMIASRITSFAAVAKVNWLYFVVFAVFHIALVQVYMMKLPKDRRENKPQHTRSEGPGDNDDCAAKTERVMLWLVSRLMYLFVDVDIKWKKCTETIRPYKLSLYALFLVENVVMFLIWYFVEGSLQEVRIFVTFGVVGIGGYLVGFVLVILFNVLSNQAVRAKEEEMARMDI